MSDIVVGIDLGTTNSAVAIPEAAEVPGVEDLLDSGRLIRVGGALVVTDKVKAATTPSAVWLDRDGTALVGRKAKQMAKMPGEPPPALFFKRLMGTSEPVSAGHGTLTPEEASSHVLAHLKGVAEEVVGGEVTRAVVTVPAFFELNARQATTRAAELAGLEVVDTLLEPVAAARMYTRTTQLEGRRRFMVYDLGGGTFDVSVVSWDDEVGFEMRGFQGDRFLGGFKFDQAIVNWMIDQLKESYDLDLDVDGDPSDAALFSRLLVFAEAEKQNLSRPAPDGLETQIVDTTSEDRAGNPMSIRLELTRDEFEGIIGDLVERTLASCDEVLEGDDEVDEIVMVGGSSLVPLVRTRLEEKYGGKPLMIDPHLCVAVGAALKAAMAPAATEYLSIDQVPEMTADESIDVSGGLRVGPELPDVAGASLRLVSDDGLVRGEAVPNDHGHFLFEDVELAPETTSRFNLEVYSAGKKIDAQPIAVRHVWEGSGPVEDAGGDHILPQDVSIAVVGGYHPVARAGTRLPSQQSASLQMANQRGSVELELNEGTNPIGSVLVTEVPTSLPIGTDVEVDMVFTREWTIEVEARIPAADRDARATIEIPKVAVRSWGELQRSHQEAATAWADKQEVAQPAELMRAGPRIDALLEQLGDLINEGQDRAHADHVAREVQAQIDRVELGATGPGLVPPMETFDDALYELDDLIRQLEGKDADAAALERTRLDALRDAGKAAWDAGNAADWAFANDGVKDAARRVQRKVGGGGGPDIDRIPVAILQMMLLQEVDGIGAPVRQLEAAGVPEAGDLRERLEAVRNELAAVDVNVASDAEEKAAKQRLMGLFQGKVNPLRQHLEALISRGGGPGVTDMPDVKLPPSQVPAQRSALRGGRKSLDIA